MLSWNVALLFQLSVFSFIVSHSPVCIAWMLIHVSRPFIHLVWYLRDAPGENPPEPHNVSSSTVTKYTKLSNSLCHLKQRTAFHTVSVALLRASRRHLFTLPGVKRCYSHGFKDVIITPCHQPELPSLVLESQVFLPKYNFLCCHSRVFTAECFILASGSPGVVKLRNEPLLQHSRWYCYFVLPPWSTIQLFWALLQGVKVSSASPAAAAWAQSLAQLHLPLRNLIP